MVRFSLTRLTVHFFTVLAILFIPFISASTANAAIGAIPKWVAIYDGPASTNSYDQPVAMAVDAAGNVYVTGQSRGVDGNDDYATIKYDSNGNQLWASRYDGGGGFDRPTALAVDNAGNVYVTGMSSSGYDPDYVTVKYDSNGNQLWASRYAGTHPDGYDRATSIAVDAAGNVYATGGSWGGPDWIGEDYATVKYDSNGNELWVARYDGDGDSGFSGENDDRATAIAVDGVGYIYVTGYSMRKHTAAGFSSDFASRDFVTIKYDSAGNQVWLKVNGTDNHDPDPTNPSLHSHPSDVPVAMALDGAGDVYVTGVGGWIGESWVDSGNNFFTVKLDGDNGATLWEAIYDRGSEEWPADMAVDAAGNVHVVGVTGSGDGRDYATVKYSAGGVQQWAAVYDGPNYLYGHDWADEATGVAVDGSGNVYVTGWVDWTKSGGSSYSYATLMYDSGGVQQWVTFAPLDDTGGYDKAADIAVDGTGNVYVTGNGYADFFDTDYRTIKYGQGNALILTAPDGGQSWTAETEQTIFWKPVAVSGNVKIELSRDGGATWESPPIASSVAASARAYAWSVRGPATTRARIRISSIDDPSVNDMSAADFTIVQSITVTSPNGGEVWVPGDSQNITWSKTGVAYVNIELSRDSGATWVSPPIASSVWAYDGRYAWTVSGAPTTHARIRVSDFRTAATYGMSASDFTIAAPITTGTTWAWGYNNSGQLGDGTTTDRNAPVQASGLTGVVAVSGGGAHGIALKSAGTVWAWGENYAGQLGDNTTTDRHTPVQVRDLSEVVAVAGGGAHSLALKSDGTVWAWGENGNGQLGNGTDVDSSVPVQVTALSEIVGIAGGSQHSLAVKSDGTVWAWGFNGLGQLGDGTTDDSNAPVQVSGLSGATAVSGGGAHSMALKSDGTVWSWGANAKGQLGNGMTTNSSVPVIASSLGGVAAVDAGGAHSLAVKSDGTVWAWGGNVNGQLGNGTTTDSSVPVQVSGLSDVNGIAGSAYHSLALKSDGRVWAWGGNVNGQLGNGTTTDSSVPVRVNGLSEAAAISAGGNHSLASKAITETPSPTLTLTSPTGGETWAAGSSHDVTWTSTGVTGNVKIELSRDGGATWAKTPIAMSVKASAGTYNWKLTGPSTTQARVRVSSITDPSVNDVSPADFAVVQSITVTSPNGGESWAEGSSHDVTWTSTGVTGNVKIELSRDGGTTWSAIIPSASVAAGSKTWKVSGTASTQARIRVSSMPGGAVSDISNADFTITGPPPPSITVSSPNGGESWAVGSTQTVSWTSSSVTGMVKVELSRDGGTTWSAIIPSAPVAAGSKTWKVSGTASTQARVRVSSMPGGAVSDISNADFTITGPPPPSITVSSPNGGESWAVDSTQTIIWSSVGLSATSRVKIELSRDGGVTWKTIVASAPNSGSKSWKVAGPTTAQARIRVSSISPPGIADVSDAGFVISNPS